MKPGSVAWVSSASRLLILVAQNAAECLETKGQSQGLISLLGDNYLPSFINNNLIPLYCLRIFIISNFII
jgi:hypothetical protein